VRSGIAGTGGIQVTDHEFVREWTTEEAAEKGVRGETLTPRVSRRGVSAASGADHRSGIALAADDKQPGLPADPPRGPTGNTEVTP
jgi:hypothetical protein